MKTKSNNLYRVPFYPILLGLYPVLFLWLANFTQSPPYAIVRSALIALGITLLIVGVCYALFRHARKAAAVSGFLLLMFFFYGHYYNLIAQLKIPLIEHHYVSLPIWIAFFALFIYLVIRAKSELLNFTWALNLVSAFLVVITLAQIGYLYAKSPRNASPPPAKTNSGGQLSDPANRDIYYILVDAHSRQDEMIDTFNYDNGSFITQLEQLGFVVPNCTQANFNNTIYSMTATLNMNYLSDLGYSYAKLAASVDENGYKATLTPSLHANQVMQKFRNAGYQIISFETPYPFVDFPNSDKVFDLESSTGILDKIESLNFQYWLMRTTMMLPVILREQIDPAHYDKLPPLVLQFIDPRDNQNRSRNYLQYLQNQYALQNLEKIPQIPGKKFVYAHLLTTHPPFTFTPTGDYLTAVPTAYFEEYKDQVIYTDQRLLEIVKTLITQSRVPPIIIIQGDHAALIENLPRFRILNAYYLPDGGKDKVYPTITPVNSFRLIFSYYYHLDYPLLPDQSIDIDRKYPGGYQAVPQTCVKVVP